MTTQSASTTQDELLEGWRQKAWLQRMFLPGDFLDKVNAVGAESLVCHKTTVEYLVMSDHVETKTVRTGDAGKYSTDLNYRPQEFKNETVKIMANSMDVGCDRCSGGGRAPCPPTERCRPCRGSGQRSSRQKCMQCDGDGEVRQAGFLNFSKERCMTCSGRGRVMAMGPCDRCSGGGQQVCKKCNGSGAVTCAQCQGSGKLVQGDLITRKFSHSKELTYQLSGLGENEFKNGLGGNHFKSMAGDLIYQEFQTPGAPETVLEQKSVHSYDVLSQEYSYNGSSFCLNRITSDGASKYVASGVPLSKIRTAIAGGAFFVASVAVAAIVILL